MERHLCLLFCNLKEWIGNPKNILQTKPQLPKWPKPQKCRWSNEIYVIKIVSSQIQVLFTDPKIILMNHRFPLQIQPLCLPFQKFCLCFNLNLMSGTSSERCKKRPYWSVSLRDVWQLPPPQVATSLWAGWKTMKQQPKGDQRRKTGMFLRNLSILLILFSLHMNCCSSSARF